MKSIILDPEVQDVLRERVRDIPEEERTPSKFMFLLNEAWLAELPLAPAKVSKETARRWMTLLGFASCEGTKRHYVEIK